MSAAAEINLSGTGTFKPPLAEKIAALPNDLGFTSNDLASGKWSFFVRYDDSASRTTPAPYVGRYTGAIREFRLVIGNTTLSVPVDQAEIIVSDGGDGFTNRESIRVETKATLASGVLRLSWVQVNQQSKGVDLRGAAGLITSVEMPPSAVMANLATVSPYDRYLELRVDRPGSDLEPLFYLSSSQISVTATTTTAP